MGKENIETRIPFEGQPMTSGLKFIPEGARFHHSVVIKYKDGGGANTWFYMVESLHETKKDAKRYVKENRDKYLNGQLEMRRFITEGATYIALLKWNCEVQYTEREWRFHGTKNNPGGARGHPFDEMHK